jgi:hypothetical protein
MIKVKLFLQQRFIFKKIDVIISNRTAHTALNNSHAAL